MAPIKRADIHNLLELVMLLPRAISPVGMIRSKDQDDGVGNATVYQNEALLLPPALPVGRLSA